MREKVDIGAIGTFGLPNGCTQSGFYSGKIKTDNKSLDLNANAIKIFPNTTLYVLRREIVSNEQSIVFGKYSFAKEKNSNRGGTFIGSFISFYNYFAEPNQVYSLLTEFHKDLVENENNISNSVLQVLHSKDLQVKLPKDFEKLNENLIALDGTDFYNRSISQDHNILVYSAEKSEDRIIKFFQNCIAFFPSHETIYFTQNIEIVEFVNEKRLLPIRTFSDFEKDIETIKHKKLEDQKRLEQQKREELRRIEEVKRLENQRKEELRRIEEQKRKDQEEVNRILSKKTLPTNNHIQFDIYKRLVNDYNKLLDWYKDLEKKNNNSSITPTQTTTTATFSDKNRSKEVKSNNKNRKILFYIIIPFLCFVFLMSNFYFLYFQEPKIEYRDKVVESVIANEEPISKLNPLANTEIDKEGKKVLFKKSINGNTIGEIVNLIFEKNPSEISKVYSFQKKDYQDNLFNLNKESFTIGKDTLCIHDSIKKIPAYKIPLKESKKS